MKQTLLIVLSVFIFATVQAQKTLISLNPGIWVANQKKNFGGIFQPRTGYSVSSRIEYVTSAGIYTNFSLGLSQVQVWEEYKEFSVWGTGATKTRILVYGHPQVAVDAQVGYSLELNKVAISLGGLMGYVKLEKYETLHYGYDFRCRFYVNNSFALGAELQKTRYWSTDYYYQYLHGTGVYANFYWYF